jgi:hypothetical protein
MRGAVAKFMDDRLPARFWDKVQPCPMSGCWLWCGAMSNGYGVVGGGPRGMRWSSKAHRHSYEVLVGSTPDGLDLDHLCRVRNCVNPTHLEPVTRQENLARSPLTAHARKHATHCKRGHEFTEENTAIAAGLRRCRACERYRYAIKYKFSRQEKRNVSGR